MTKPTPGQTTPWGQQLNDFLDTLLPTETAHENFVGRDRPTKHAPGLGIFFPEAEGALGDGVTDDTFAIQAAMDAAQAAGGGTVLLSRRYGWTGDLIHRGGVAVRGASTQRLEASTAPLTASAEHGLIALSGTARYVYGTSGGGSIDDNPGPLSDLIIDGRSIGGVTELFLMQSAQGRLTSVDIVNSAGDGMKLNGMAQNSNIDACYIGHHVGSSVVFKGVATFQGAGGNKFNNCWIGDGARGLYYTAEDGGSYSHDNIFNGCLFELRNNPIDSIIHMQAGDAQFRSCVFTRSTGVGTTVTQDALIVVENPLFTASSTIALFDSCWFNGGGATVTDCIRMTQTGIVGNEVRMTGRNRVTLCDTLVCSDAGNHLFSNEGTVSRGSGVAWYRTINSGTLAGFQLRTANPLRFEMPDNAGLATPVEVRREGDTQPRGTTDRDFGLRWYDGSNVAVRGSLTYDSASNSIRAGGIWQMDNAFSLRHNWINVTTTGQAVALSGASTALPGTTMTFANGTSATVSVSGGSTGSQMQVLIDALAVTTSASITWPAGISFIGTAPQPIPGSAFVVNLVNWNSVWYADYPVFPISQLEANRVTTGVETFPREFADQLNTTLPTGTLGLTYFTAYKDQTVASLRTATGNTAAGATPTLCRLGLYSVASNGDLTLIASTPNDTTLWAAATTIYTKALSASVNLARGQRYALACLVVTAAAAPTLVANQPSSIFAAEAPRLTGQLGGQTDLPASVTAGSVVATNRRVYGECL